MRGKRAVCVALGLVLMCVTLAGCSGQADQGDKGVEDVSAEEEMSRDLVEVGDVIEVEENDEAIYTVTITEDNLIADRPLAVELGEDVAVDEAGLGGEAEGSEPKPADETIVIEEQSVDETIIVEEQPAEDVVLEEELPTEEAAAPAEQPAEQILAGVTQEDVAVSYEVELEVADGEEPAFETRQAQVTGFANDGMAVTLTFQGEPTGGLDFGPYTVRFQGMPYYAMVQVNRASGDGAQVTSDPSDVVIEDVDYDAQIAELAEYKPDFADEDIALPEGIYFEDGEVVVTEDASEVVRETLVDMGMAEEEEMSRAVEDAQAGDAAAEDAVVQYMKESNARKKKYDNYSAASQYTVEVLDYIDPTAGKVASMGDNAFKIFKGYTTNDWGSALEGTMGVLKTFGLFKSSGGGVSNEQILSEVQKVGIEVADMHGLTKAMNSKLDEVLRQAYANNLQSFDNAVNALAVNAEPLQVMLTEGAIRAFEDGIEPPAEDCSAEDEFEYNFALIEYIKGLEKKGGRKNSAFIGFSDHMSNLTENFALVAGEVAKPAETNPVKAFDKYWDLYFNYESQGYYLRRSYRSSIEFELKRAFALIEIYYNIFDPYTKGAHMSYNNLLFDALDRLEQFDAGLSPKQVKASANIWRWSGFHLHVNTFNRTITSISYTSGMQGNNVPSGMLEEYISRLHDRSMQDDFKLAGIWLGRLAATDKNGVTTAIDQQWYGEASTYVNGAHGIGFNGTYKDNWYKADIIGYDKKLHKEEQTLSTKGKNLTNSFDKPWSTEWAYSMPYIVFTFA